MGMVNERTGVVPPQRKGASSDIEYTVRTADEDRGKKLYDKARNNLLNINCWHTFAGRLSARFFLTDPYGKRVDRLPLQGDFIQIHLPGMPDDKLEWVRIEAIEEERNHLHFNWLTIRVRPSDPPREQEETEHFFSKEATSSFTVQRKGRAVTASVKGRNELPNTEADGFLNKIRNAVIAIAAMAGLNAPQWKGLVKGLLKK
jgi:hypothetical protein